MPADTPVVVVPATHADMAEFLSRDYVRLLDELTPARLHHLQELPFDSLQVGKAHAILFVPHGADAWMPVWLLDAPRDRLSALLGAATAVGNVRTFESGGETVYRFDIGDRTLQAVQLGRLLIVSEHPSAVERSMRAYKGDLPRVETPMPEPGSLWVNLGHFGGFAETEVALDRRGPVAAVFRQLSALPLAVRLSERKFEGGAVNMEAMGTMAPPPASAHPAIRHLTGTVRPAGLESHVPADALFFAMFAGKTTDSAPNDRALAELNRLIAARYAFARLPGGGDGLWVRLVPETDALQLVLTEGQRTGAVVQEGEHYRITDPEWMRVLTGGQSDAVPAWVRLGSDVMWIAERAAVTDRAVADHRRGRTLATDPDFATVRADFNLETTGFLYARSLRLLASIEPLLRENHRLGRLAEHSDVLAMSFEPGTNGLIQVDLRSYRLTQGDSPYADGWSSTLDGYAMSGPAVFADLDGDADNDVVVATRGGTLFAFGSDGVERFRVPIESDGVQGSPTVTDWFRNGIPTILMGAGTQVYGWNRDGTPLPNFPVSVGDILSAPILVADLRNSGLPELVVATVDRRIHILDRRGNPLPGWPKQLPEAVSARPAMVTVENDRYLMAYADDRLYAWDIRGQALDGFPIRWRGGFSGAIAAVGSHVVLGTWNGEIVAIGDGPLFTGRADSRREGRWTVQSIRLGQSAMRVFGAMPELEFRTNGRTRKEAAVLAVGAGGELRVVGKSGELLRTDELMVGMGNGTPLLGDVTGDGRPDLLATTGYGRLVAWDLYAGERYEALPTVAIYDATLSPALAGEPGTWLVGDSPDGIRVWRLRGGGVIPPNP